MASWVQAQGRCYNYRASRSVPSSELMWYIVSSSDVIGILSVVGILKVVGLVKF